MIIIIVLAAWIYLYSSNSQQYSGNPIKVGILHSLTGTMSISERSVVDAELMAIDEINANGGVLGRQIVPIVVDGQSNWPHFAEMARKLITQDKVSVIFGCWTSASRKTVKPVFEKYGSLLFTLFNMKDWNNHLISFTWELLQTSKLFLQSNGQ